MARAIGIFPTLALWIAAGFGCTSDRASPDALDAASSDARAEENGLDSSQGDALPADAIPSDADPGDAQTEASPDAIDGALDAGPVDPDARDDASVPDGDASSDSDVTDASVCDIERPVVKIGCKDTPMPATLTVDGVATQVVGYACRADNVDTLVRIRACVSPPSNACIADAGEDFCAVVDIPASVLDVFVPDGTLSLDGTTTFKFDTPMDTHVKPENVTYTPAQMNGITRVWMESECFCTPVPTLIGSQTVRGGLTIEVATRQYVAGRIALSAEGHISPVNYRQRQIDLSIFFNVPRGGPVTDGAAEPR